MASDGYLPMAMAAWLSLAVLSTSTCSLRRVQTTRELTTVPMTASKAASVHGGCLDYSVSLPLPFAIQLWVWGLGHVTRRTAVARTAGAYHANLGLYLPEEAGSCFQAAFFPDQGLRVIDRVGWPFSINHPRTNRQCSTPTRRVVKQQMSKLQLRDASSLEQTAAMLQAWCSDPGPELQDGYREVDQPERITAPATNVVGAQASGA
ncbi:hypothetical protein EG328_010401 [Venturia inaequalis]|uniref:Uncharacterized protein n=1 Tax=Venturia inaequalis TaxID=5025 RepID=A0A8H3V8D3_VENIN|nr:hypothetical protein EG328_010401 [Venturia inaequalis]